MPNKDTGMKQRKLKRKIENLWIPPFPQKLAVRPPTRQVSHSWNDYIFYELQYNSKKYTPLIEEDDGMVHCI